MDQIHLSYEDMLKEMNIADSVDRIGALPDAVLRHILSFLPTKTAVGTSILSTRWRYLFPFSNNLDFDDSLVFNRRVYDQDGQTSRFVNFVDRCIMLMNETHVDKFRLKCDHVEASRINSWICVAPLRNVRELDLSFHWFGDQMPFCVFTFSTLVALKLHSALRKSFPDSVNLPSLKTFHLYSIYFLHDDSTRRLFSGCPVLEDLEIVECFMVREVVLNLSSPCLKRLTITKGRSNLCCSKLVLDAPNLVYLNYTIFPGQVYMFKNLYSLSEAHIFVVEPYHKFPRTALPEFFAGIGSVQSLSLSGDYLQYLPSALDEMRLFGNLTDLALTCEPFLKTSVLMKLLRCTPNLEKFFFEGSICDDGCVDVPSRLKEIGYKLRYCACSTIEENVNSLECVIKNANFLKKVWMRIEFGVHKTPEDVDRWLEIMLETMMKTLKKVGMSETCEVKVDPVFPFGKFELFVLSLFYFSTQNLVALIN